MGKGYAILSEHMQPRPPSRGNQAGLRTSLNKKLNGVDLILYDLCTLSCRGFALIPIHAKAGHEDKE